MKLASVCALVAVALPLAACGKSNKSKSDKPKVPPVVIDPDFRQIDGGEIKSMSDFLVINYSNGRIVTTYDANNAVKERATREFDGKGREVYYRDEERNGAGVMMLDSIRTTTYNEDGEETSSTSEAYDLETGALDYKIVDSTVYSGERDHVRTTTDTRNGETTVRREERVCSGSKCVTREFRGDTEIERREVTENADGDDILERVYIGEFLSRETVTDPETRTEVETQFTSEHPQGIVTDRTVGYKSAWNINLERMNKFLGFSQTDSKCTVANKRAQCTTKTIDLQTNQIEEQGSSEHELIQVLYTWQGIQIDMKFASDVRSTTETFEDGVLVRRESESHDYDAQGRPLNEIRTCENPSTVESYSKCKHAKEIETETTDAQGRTTEEKVVNQDGALVSRITVEY